MKQILPLVGTLFLLLPAIDKAAPAHSGGASGAGVTMESLLNEMIDREEVAQWPAPAFVLKQASSHDRRKNDPSNPETWHSNNDHEQFLYTEVNVHFRAQTRPRAPG